MILATVLLAIAYALFGWALYVIHRRKIGAWKQLRHWL